MPTSLAARVFAPALLSTALAQDILFSHAQYRNPMKNAVKGRVSACGTSAPLRWWTSVSATQKEPDASRSTAFADPQTRA